MFTNNKDFMDEMIEARKKIVAHIVRLTVWNLDGTTSEMKFTYPPFCWNGDDSNRAGQHLEEWCREMTRYFLKITHYQVHLGSLNVNGEEKYSMSFAKEEIPLNKIFIPGKARLGKWVTPYRAEQTRQKKTAAYYNKQMKKGRHPLSGAQVRCKANTQIYLN